MSCEWVNIKDKKPPHEPFKEYLVFIDFFHRSRIELAQWYPAGQYFFNTMNTCVTHWMELPKFPEESFAQKYLVSKNEK